jgi:putative ATP-dependent endonuclease of OLD family
MKLIQLRIRNFRCYKDEISIDFDDMTALVGRNDAGKSSVMDALDIFFNDSVPDKNDASKDGDPSDLAIIGVFSDLPESLVLDQAEFTSLQSEYLLNSDDNIEIHKIFNGSLDKPKLTFLHLVALHPTAEHFSDLMQLNNSELKKRAIDVGADTTAIDKKVNAQLRSVIRTIAADLELNPTELSLMEGNGQSVWKGIQAVLPAFALFKSDRTSTDQDPEAQDPLNAAIKEAVKQKEAELNAIAAHIEQEVKKIADLTLKKLQEMDPSLATTLSPQFPVPKWANLFKASITGDGDIPINKRGSGVRRLILLNFFRAKSEQLMRDNNKQNAIYAVEEPETSQHPHNQRMLVSALQELAGRDQVIITTHTPMLARVIPSTSLRFINTRDDKTKEILKGGDDDTNNKIAKSLGVLPDHNVRLFIGVEGKHDIPFLKGMSRMLINAGEDVPDLEQLEVNGEVIFTPLGGSLLAIWCNRLANLNRPEFHIYDRDTAPPAPPKYQQYADEVNARNGCMAISTNKREAENYIHYEAINLALVDAGIGLVLGAAISDFDDVPAMMVDQINAVVPQHNKWKENRAKEFLCNAATSKMTKDMLDETDPNGDVIGWFNNMGQMLKANQI